jgi:hypothetical protein
MGDANTVAWYGLGLICLCLSVYYIYPHLTESPMKREDFRGRYLVLARESAAKPIVNPFMM